MMKVDFKTAGSPSEVVQHVYFIKGVQMSSSVSNIFLKEYLLSFKGFNMYCKEIPKKCLYDLLFNVSTIYTYNRIVFKSIFFHTSCKVSILTASNAWSIHYFI